MKSVYIHIPFCNKICSYCDFCKVLYESKWVIPYLESLKKEIVSRYNNEPIRTLYIGGGTPSSLSINELIYLFDILKLLDLSELEEFTFECNIESLSYEKLILLKKNRVNRLSFGIQSFNKDNLMFLGIERNNNKVYEMIDIIKNIGFDNINLDLMYAIPNQTLEMLEKDLDTYISLNPEHISCYSLIIEPNTKLYINKEKNIDQDLDYEMYKYIEDRLKGNGYIHYELSNYAKENYYSKHNLTYWNNEEYYGFGVGASSYLDLMRIDNHRSLTKYISNDFSNNVTDTKDDVIKDALILGLRKIKGINIEEFNKRYDSNIELLLKKFIEQNKIEIKDGQIYIVDEWIYKMNEILMEII